MGRRSFFSNHVTDIGGRNVSTTIEGRQRFRIQIRLPRSERDDIEKLSRILVAGQPGTAPAATPSGRGGGMDGGAATTSSPAMADGDGEAYISLGMIAMIPRDVGANEIAFEIGGMISSLIHILIVTPVIVLWLRGLTFKRGHCMNPSGVRAH